MDALRPRRRMLFVLCLCGAVVSLLGCEMVASVGDAISATAKHTKEAVF